MENSDFGVTDISFKLYNKQKYIFNIKSKEILQCVVGLLEKRYPAERGFIKREDDLFMQSDRLLLEDRVISNVTYNWLGMGNDFFYLAGIRKSKRYYVDLLKAKDILHYPVYKLKKDDKIKFVLLSLLFQKNGLILISKLLNIELNENMKHVLSKILIDSHKIICIFHDANKNCFQLDQYRDYNVILIPNNVNSSK